MKKKYQDLSRSIVWLFTVFRPYVACRLNIIDLSLLRGRVSRLVSLGCFNKLYHLQARTNKDLVPQPFHKNLLYCSYVK